MNLMTEAMCVCLVLTDSGRAIHTACGSIPHPPHLPRVLLSRMPEKKYNSGSKYMQTVFNGLLIRSFWRNLVIYCSELLSFLIILSAASPYFFFFFQVCEIKNCNKCIYFEAKKKQDLYMWKENVIIELSWVWGMAPHSIPDMKIRQMFAMNFDISNHM